MAKLWAGLSAGILAGAAGATALNAVNYADQAVRGNAPTSSAAGPHVASTAAEVTKAGPVRAAALGPLGGLGVGVAVGALAGLVRGSAATPPPVLAAVATGLVAMAAGDGVALATGTARPDWRAPVTLLRELVPHLVYGAVTGIALHRMLDPQATDVRR